MSRTTQDAFNQSIEKIRYSSTYGKPSRKEADAPHDTPVLPAVNVCRSCTRGLHDLDCKGSILDLLSLTVTPCECYCTRGGEVPC